MVMADDRWFNERTASRHSPSTGRNVDEGA
jgi:hypothetical protein